MTDSPAHYGDLRAAATQWWALQRARIRLTLTVGAAKRAGWGTPGDHLSVGAAAVLKAERAAARTTMGALAAVYPVVAQLVEETVGLGPAVAAFLGLVPPLRRLEEFPGFPCPAALWAYSGLSPERRKKCDRRARMIAIAYIATPAILRGGDFHALYVARRTMTVERGWTKMHAHRDGVRYVAKRILKMLWLCRLPVGSPVLPLLPQGDFTVAGASPLVALPNNTAALLDSTHDGEASAPESDDLPFEEMSPATALSTPESDAHPDIALAPLPTVSAPEPVARPIDVLTPNAMFTAPESAARPLNGLAPSSEFGTPESVLSPELLLLPVHDVTAPELARSPHELVSSKLYLGAAES